MGKFFAVFCLCLLPFQLYARDIDVGSPHYWEVLNVDRPNRSPYADPESLTATDISGEEIFSLPLRLTNLRNVRSSRNISELPNWNGNYNFGWIFDNASNVSPHDYERDWGHEGCGSDNFFGRSIFLNVYDPDYKAFSFHKYIQGEDIEVTQPKMVDFSRLGTPGKNFRILVSTSPYYPNGSGELLLFIPYLNGLRIINVGGRLVRIPYDERSSSNYDPGRVDPGDGRTSGICLVFHPISTDTPHDIYPQKNDKTVMDGAAMSSFRNKSIVEYSEEQGADLFAVDWGYQGYYEEYEDIVTENLAPLLNEDCRCINSSYDVVGYNGTTIFQMSCRDRAAGQAPVEVLQSLDLTEHFILINGKVPFFDGSQPGLFNGADIGYAYSYAVKNQDFTSAKIRNGSNGNILALTHYPRGPLSISPQDVQGRYIVATLGFSREAAESQIATAISTISHPKGRIISALRELPIELPESVNVDIQEAPMDDYTILEAARSAEGGWVILAECPMEDIMTSVVEPALTRHRNKISPPLNVPALMDRLRETLFN